MGKNKGVSSCDEDGLLVDYLKASQSNCFKVCITTYLGY